MLIVVSGLPGTGKTTVAAALARRLNAAHLSVDVMEAEHKRRLQRRERGLVHIPEPTWDQVVLRTSVYEPWTDACPVVDTNAGLESVVDRAHRCLEDDR